MEKKFEALGIPPDAAEKGGVEILRASVVDGAVSVALRRAFEDPFTWGVLVDLARHAARVYGMETEIWKRKPWPRFRPASAPNSTIHPTPARPKPSTDLSIRISRPCPSTS